MNDSTSRGRLARWWHDPVGSGVIVAVIVAVLGSLATYAWGLWPAFVSAAALTWGALLTPSQIPTVLVVLVTLTATVLGAQRVRSWAAAKRAMPPPTARDYLEDQFMNMTWRWRWRFGQTFQIAEFRFFCASCDYEIVPKESHPYARVETIFRCDRCGEERARLENSLDALHSAAEREVHRKIRVGEWRLALEAARSRHQSLQVSG